MSGIWGERREVGGGGLQREAEGLEGRGWDWKVWGSCPVGKRVPSSEQEFVVPFVGLG